MPKCINDETKFYSGYEPSPRGLGYSADKFEQDHKQLGKDGNMYIVKKTTRCNRWIKFDEPTKESSSEPTKESSSEPTKESSSESFKITKLKKIKDKVLMCVESNGNESWQDFDFGKLSEDFYVYAYLPICEKMVEHETGLEEKFGGSFPYLIKNTEIKADEYDNESTFLCQFRDPRSEDDSMYQVFVREDLMGYDIRKIKWNKAAIKKQYKDNIMSALEPYKIVGWNKIKELVTFKKLCEKLKFSKEVEEILWDAYYDHPLFPSSQIKVGGSPVSCQSIEYDNMDLLQLTDSEFLNFSWGDSGIAHISTDLELEWDCC
jgi:hypothetical protein